VQGGNYNTLVRALERLGLADVYGRSQIPLYVMNVAYPVIESEVLRFAAGKRALLIVEEGQPNFIEQTLATVLRHGDAAAVLHGKDLLPRAGEYTLGVVRDGLREFLERYGRLSPANRPVAPAAIAPAALAAHVHARPPGFCTGCPERPIFSAIKLVERELGEHHMSADIGCHLFSILPPFHLGNTTMGYGLGTAGASAFNPPVTRGAGEALSGRRAISVMGDGGFWHNGLTSGVANAVFNRDDGILVIMKNGYSSATGTQELPSSPYHSEYKANDMSIERALQGLGVDWMRTVHTYHVGEMKRTLKDAMTTQYAGLKVIIADGECQLERQRRVRPETARKLAGGERVVRVKYGVDEDTCTGDHSCIRLSGCPTLTVKDNPDPLRTDPVATVIDGCVGCGLCGENAHAAVLCPSFYRAEVIQNASLFDRLVDRLRRAIVPA